MTDFSQKYGPRALVAGGAPGIGEAFSRFAASQGLNVIALDFNQSALDEMAAKLSGEYGVECLPVKVDLSAVDMLEIAEIDQHATDNFMGGSRPGEAIE